MRLIGFILAIGFLAVEVFGQIVLTNRGLESPVVGNGEFVYSPSGAGWSMGGGTGIAGNGSGFSRENPGAPEGSQVAFIQGTGRFSQRVSGFKTNTTYTIRFKAAQRAYGQLGNTWNVLVDTRVVRSFAPPQSATFYVEYSATFETTDGAHDIAFVGTNTRGGDNTVFIDDIWIDPPPSGRVALDGSGVRVEFSAIPWRTYAVEYKSNLNASAWLPVFAQEVAAGPDALLTLATDLGAPEEYFRIGARSTGLLPLPWGSQDIGIASPAGSARYTNGVFTARGAGADIGGSSDAFRFVFRSITGDAEVIARVVSQQNTSSTAKAGVMLRGALAANAAHMLAAMTPGSGALFVRRMADGGASSQTLANDGAKAPYWVRLTRIGSTVTAYKSKDGRTWMLMGSEEMSLPETIYAGIAVCSRSASTLNTSEFDNVIVRAPVLNVDYDGHPFVTNAAPVLAFERKAAPNLEGIDYPFPEQTAHGVALLSRFPAFNLSDRRIHVDGPWYDSPSNNLHFTRGITTIGALPNYRSNDDSATTLRKVGRERKWSLMTDPMWWGHANTLANQLAAANPNDARIPALRALADDHVFTNNREAYLALGNRVFQQERMPLDIEGKFVLFPCLDIEQTGGWEYQRNCFGWLYEGLAEAAQELNLPIVPMLYGQWQYSVGAFYESMRQGGTGQPEYLLPEKDFIAATDPTLTMAQRNGGIISMDGYLQAIWGNEPFYNRNADGSLRLTGGLPTFSNATKTRVHGWDISLEAGEAKHALDDLYRQAVRMYLQHHRMAGQYPLHSGLRKTFLSNCKIGAWSRYTNEGLQGITQNDRPIPPWLLEMLIGIYLFTADDITLWSSDMNFAPAQPGGDFSGAWRYNAHGVLESVVKAAHRYSALDELHTTNQFRWCWFNLPVINKNETAGDRYFEKPLAFGKLRTFENRTWLELFVAWPALDQTSKTFKVWIDQSNVRSSAYTIRLANGRSYFYDAWQLPENFQNLQGSNVWLRATDLMNTQRTWRGDWRQTATNTVPTPPDFVP